MSDLNRFFVNALLQAMAREWRGLGLLLAALLIITNMVILNEMLNGGGKTSPTFIIAALVRLLGLFFFMVALMRRAVSSPRSMFMPDGAFWASMVLGLIGTIIAGLAGQLLPEDSDAFVVISVNNLSSILTLPLAVWTVALATRKPLALDPRPWFKRLSHWLPALIIAHLLFILPIALLHGYIDAGLVEGTIARSLWLEIIDGALSCIILLISLGLMVTAYRRVANP